MQKYLLALSFVLILAVAGCGSKQQSVSTPATGEVVQQTGDLTKPRWTVVTGNVSFTDDDFQQMLEIMHDLPVAERSYSFSDDQGNHTSIPGFRVLTSDSGTVLQQIQSGNVVWESKQGSDVVGQLLGFDKKITGIYGPFTQTQQPESFAIYTVAGPYGAAVQEQYVLDVETKKTTPSPYIFLYHVRDGLYATQSVQGEDHLYSGLVKVAASGDQVLLTGSFDSFAFDGYRLFAARTLQADTTDTVSLTILDTMTDTVVQTIAILPIGRDAKFLLQDHLLTAFYGVPDFTNETTSQHILRYDIDKQQVIWEVKISE